MVTTPRDDHVSKFHGSLVQKFPPSTIPPRKYLQSDRQRESLIFALTLSLQLVFPISTSSGGYAGHSPSFPTIQPLSARSQPLSLSDDPPCHSLNPRNSSPRGLLPLLRSLINLLYTASRPNPVAGGYLVSPADDIICRERLRIAASTTAAGTPNNFLAFESPMRPRHHDSARDHTTR